MTALAIVFIVLFSINIVGTIFLSETGYVKRYETGDIFASIFIYVPLIVAVALIML